jgi:hypothetical protein
MIPVTRHPSLVTAAAIAAALALGGCDYLPWTYTKVKDILAAPAQFEGQEVKVKGKVVRVAKILALRGFVLRDETGEITVITYGKLPAENEDVASKGKVLSAVIMGTSAIGLRVEETQRLR